jgi:AsmA protein
MKSGKNTIKLALSVTGAILVCLVIAVYFIDINKYKPRIEKAASEALGMDMRIEGAIRIALFPSFGISLEKVAVKNRGAEIVSANRVGIGLDLIPLLRQEVRINDLEFSRPSIVIEKDSRGIYNFERQGLALPRAEGPPGEFPEIRRAAISRGELSYSDKKSGNRIELKDFSLTIRNLSSSGREGEDLLKRLSFEGDFRCREIVTKNRIISDLAASINAKDGILDINPVTLKSFGESEKGNLRVDMTGAIPAFTLRYSAARYHLDRFSDAVLQKKFMEGEAEVSLNLSSRGKSLDEIKRKLNGEVSLRGEDLLLYSVDIDSLLSKIEESQNFSLVDVGAFFFAGPLGTALTKGYDFAGVYRESGGGKGSIKKLVSDWKIKNGIAEAEDVALSTKRHRIALKGRLDFINERFDDITIAALDEKGCARFSQKISGSFAKPQVEKISMLRSIAGPALSFFEKTKKFLAGGKCEVFYGGSVKHPQ